MSTPILATKLYVPPPRTTLVLRPRLIERLNEGLHRKLTLISAPAGFGKTTLVSEWVAGCGRPTAWVSLEEADSEPIRFLTYLVAAVRTIAPNFGVGVLPLLQAPQPAPLETVLTALLNDIATLPDPFVLVLDDYHVIDTPALDAALTFLLDHLSPHLHLVIATREDPHLPLARLRVRGQLTELRAADLRFTPAEVAGFLNQVMGLHLSADAIAVLETRTEGWIAGLQLAALSLQGHPSPARFIESFTGNHHYVLDYLIEEVLHGQPQAVQHFLLHTSMLDRLCGALCDAVLLDSSASGQATLEYLERANLFLIPLDNERRWYRYHHLFAEVLQARALADQPDERATLHQRASHWYEQQGLRFDAIRHALVAHDDALLADLLELVYPAMDEGFQSTMWLGWVKKLPDDVVRARPVLSVGYAWACLNEGVLEAAEARLQDAERWLDADAPSSGMTVIDSDQFRLLPASIAIARAYRAQALNDIPATIKYTRQVLDRLPQGEDHRWRGAATSLLGLAYWANGDLIAAHRTLADYMTATRKADSITDTISVTFLVADILIGLGRLREAASIYDVSLRFALGGAGQPNEPPPLGTSDLYRGMSEIACEWGDLEAAAHHLQIGEALGEQAALTNWHYRLGLAQAQLKAAQGDWAGALERLDEAERQYIRTPLLELRPVAALKARLWVAQNDHPKAFGWLQAHRESLGDQYDYLREFEQITAASVLITSHHVDGHHHHDGAAGALQDGVQMLERLWQAAYDGKRVGSLIEIRAWQAIAVQAQGDPSSALALLEDALTLAEPEGYVRLFVNMGAPMRQLLTEAGGQGMLPEYVGRLLASFEPIETPTPITTSSVMPPIPPASLLPPLLDPLTDRELEVLRLVAEGLSNREISERLFLALSTVKGYNLAIFDKLQVQRRTEAVARARALGLL